MAGLKLNINLPLTGRRCQCQVCHAYFDSVLDFDHHLRIDDNGRTICLDPESVGMIEDDLGLGCWHYEDIPADSPWLDAGMQAIVDPNITSDSEAVRIFGLHTIDEELAVEPVIEVEYINTRNPWLD